MGENGLIRQAEKAGEYQANAEAEDRANLGALDEHLANAIAKANGGSEEETPDEPQNPETPTEPTLVTMYNAAVTAGCIGGEDCTDPENHLHIGDYVNYQNPTEGTKTILAADSGMATAGTRVADQTFEITEEKKSVNSSYL